MEAARTAFNRGEYLDAARTFDALYIDAPAARLLHMAAVAWATLGEDTRAILRWRRFLADSGANREETALARAFLDEARKRTTAVTIAAEPRALIRDAIVELTPASGPAEPYGPFSFGADELTDDIGTAVLFLGPGRWRINLVSAHAGYATASAEFDIDPAVATDTLALSFPPREGELRVDVTAKASARLRLVFTDAAELEPPREVALAQTSTVTLRAGLWRYSLLDPVRGELVRGEVEVDADSVGTLALAAPQSALAGDQRRPRLELGLGLFAATIGASGLGLVLPSSLLLAKREIRTPEDAPPGLRPLAACDPDATTSGDGRLECVLLGGGDVQAAGAALTSAAVGVGVSALVSRAAGARRVPRWVALSVGLASATAGGIWLRRGLADMAAVETASYRVLDHDVFRARQVHVVASAALLGLGSGALLGSSLSLLHDLTPRRRDAASARRIQVSPTFSGAALALSF